jgi:protein-S-isoprenylcysteine O-methyltransferase Ste14
MVALIYGGLCYVLFLLTFLYAIGFVGNVMVPKSIDSGAAGSISEALLVDVVLLGLFAIQHSVMARQGFKRWWTQFVPRATERSTYVLLSSLILILLFWQWRPLPDVVWSVTNSAAAGVLTALFWLGWAVVLISTFLINHFDLFGLQQVWAHAQGRQNTRASARRCSINLSATRYTSVSCSRSGRRRSYRSVTCSLPSRPPATSLSGFCWRNETSSPSMGRRMSNTVRASP